MRRWARASSSSVIASVSPATVTALGALTAAMVRREPSLSSARSSAACACPKETAVMQPCPRVRPWCALRSWITRTAWSSVNAPLAQAAATSPTLWPHTCDRSYPSALQGPRQADLDREQGRLRDLR